MIENTEELQGQLIATGNVIASMVAQKGNKGDKGDKGDTGAQGVPGQDGFSPSASVSKVGSTATITITDKDGTTTATISDGLGDMLKSVYDTDDDGIVDNAEKVNNHTVLSDVPADAVFTDTTYTAGTGISISSGNVISNTQTSAEWGNITGTLADQTDLNTALGNKADSSSLATVATSGSYADLSNTPTIPTKISDLTNDSNFEVNTNKVTSISSLSTDTQYASAKCLFNELAKLEVVKLDNPSTYQKALNFFNGLTKGNYIFDRPGKVDKLYMYLTENSYDYYSDAGPIFMVVHSTFDDAEVNDVLAELLCSDKSSGKCRFNRWFVKKSNATSVAPYKAESFLNFLTEDAQNIEGVKKFTSVPKVSDNLAPTTDYELSTKKYVDDGLSSKQATLVSGTNIKTINSTSLLGSGDIELGTSIPIQNTAPLNPEEDDLWIDTSIPSSTLDFLNVFYPVGTYYETSNTSFDPNIAWGGTWVEDSKGRVTVGQDTNDTSFDTIGETGGEKTHTLTTNEMPSHNHGFDQPLGRFYDVGDDALGGPYNTRNNGYSTATLNAGGGQAHNNLQPYIVVKRWHRTA